MSTISTGATNDACAATTARVDAGAAAGKLKLRAADTTLLATFTMNDPAYGAPVAGVATANGFPKSVNAVASGIATNYEVTDSDDNVEISGTVGQGSGDVDLNNVNIVLGQQVTINSLTHTQPAS